MTRVGPAAGPAVGADVTWTADEMMTIAAARQLTGGCVCLVGIGLPNVAANLALRTHAPDCVLVYESGVIGAQPTRVPLSIGDGDLADTAVSVVSVPELFNYWLQGGRIDVGFLGAAQIDRFANLNSTVIGDYGKGGGVRLPGAGGAPEIASSAKEVIVVIRQSRRTFVDGVDFVTTAGFLDGGEARAKLGVGGGGPRMVITDLGILTPDPATKELTLASIHLGVTVEQVLERTGWPLLVAPDLTTTDPPSPAELAALRALRDAGAGARAGAGTGTGAAAGERAG